MKQEYLTGAAKKALDEAKEELKNLLICNVCARLPYGVFVKDEVDDVSLYTTWYHPHIDSCRPYLRPMSSMTPKEDEEWSDSYLTFLTKLNSTDFCEPCLECLAQAHGSSVDWLNAHYFDYRGLIEKGLAIEITDENNPYK